MSRDEIEVLEVNSRFYAAFAGRDGAALEGLWAQAVPVTCVHPGWDALRGREEVVRSFRAILAGDPPAIRCSAASAQVLGEAAVVVCHEHVPGAGRLVATNVFIREGGAWRLCHHQAGPLQQATADSSPGAMA